MARLKKAITIEQYEDKGRGVTVPIGYNPNPGMHYHEATVQGETFTHVEIGEVRKWVAARIAAMYAVTWQAVIEARFDLGSHRYSDMDQKVGMQLDFGRFWVGRVASGGLRRAAWGKEAEIPWRSSFGTDQTPPVPEDKRVESSSSFWVGNGNLEFAPPMAHKPRYSGQGDTVYYYPYSEDLWDGLVRVKAEIERVGALVRDLLNVDGDAYLALSSIVQGNLLAATVQES